ncbi:MAG: histidine--tRNA ligase [Microscillaceae bacterium]|nr:histidine--tRNA ligase [Microscillaceae bacterium]MDW8461662.1 histidine--tRNA ligase [Cytophagales bacterium]
MQKPTLPKGTRDFAPEVMVKRNFIIQTIKQTFENFGFLPLETPALENLNTLMGKYGEEGDRLIFKILNSGDFLKDIQPEHLAEGYKKMTWRISEKALKYDLTVPLARFVVMNQGKITFPFRRYQIQPVWRGDSPQAGRYREFYQCDADVVGTDSLICEAEIILMINEVLQNLGLTEYSVKINNRKILAGIAQTIGMPQAETELCTAIDKIDKIGKQKVEAELAERGFPAEAIAQMQPFFAIQGDIFEKIQQLKPLLQNSEIGTKGITELEQTLELVKHFCQSDNFISQNHLDFDITLARGLNYYTGAIFEVKVHNLAIGSISGGGRYDNLTGAFGLPNVSGVGFSFGLDRIFDVLEKLNLFPAHTHTTTQVMFTNFDQTAQNYALSWLQKTRKAGIKAEIYPQPVKLKKQLDYANQKNIPFVVLIGSEEMEKQMFSLKDMQIGTQQQFHFEEMIAYIKKNSNNLV